MTLQYDVTGIKQFAPEELFIGEGEDVTLNPMTKAIIEIAAYIGMDEITGNNVREFHRRTAMLSVIGMMFLRDTGPNNEPTMRNPIFQELEMHIGMKVNIDRLTKAKFHSSFLTLIKDAADEYVRQEKEMVELEVTKTEEADRVASTPSNVIDATDKQIWTPGDKE